MPESDHKKAGMTAHDMTSILVVVAAVAAVVGLVWAVSR